MSIWTSAIGIMIFEQVPKSQIEEIYNDIYTVIGETVDPNKNNNEKTTIPLGSEGSLKWCVGKYPTGRFDGEEYIYHIIVNIFGNLRDYDNMDEVEQWFFDVASKLEPSQSSISISCGDKVIRGGGKNGAEIKYKY